LLALAEKYQLDLIGGDTTQGARTLTVQALGLIPNGEEMRRSSAKVGDLIYLTGKIGNAGLGLKISEGYLCENPTEPLRSFNQPFPMIEAGLAIRKIAHACIDLSDGLVADLGHILKKSHVGARINVEQLPLSTEVKNYIQATGNWKLPLVSGDDYQLCFTLPPENKPYLNIDYTCIGTIEAELGLRIQQLGKTVSLETKGYEHFS
jgi:thiamine-monophosphate kinase